MIDSPLLQHVQGYINGQWVDADSGKRVAVTNPATGELLHEIPNMGAAETERAIAAARGALAKPASLDQRRQWLEAIAAALTEHRDEIGRILTLEHGKPLAEGKGEVDYAAGFFAYCAKHVHELAPRKLDEQPRGCSWTVHYRPAGVVGLITPWNFPAGMIAKKLSAAIAADCPSVIKPSSKTPLTMIALFTLLHDVVKLPAGKVNLVMGSAGPIGDTLCAHPDVRVVSFTGSTEVGRELIKKCAPEVKKLTLELGGNAPYIIFDDADLDAAADNLIANKFRGGGQTCVCANRILVQSGAADAFASRLQERVSKMTVGDGMAEGTDIGPLIDRNGFDKVRRHVQDAVDKGAEIVAGELPKAIDQDWGGFFPPTILKGATPEMACWREETFGPLVPLVEFADEAQAIELANATEFGLASYLFTRDDARADRVIAQLEFAHVGHNTGTGPTPEAPFGGMKQSGYGREGGLEGLFEFIEPQTVPRGA
ncbi:succinate-semialdehyde dehydrogenase/glutarate-semialdehyde dehydrogenase [Natronocella acetinitrilica]|uniref:Succinate-semialdehyde dehydrogenase/glutarate-semialdehyde dehydrogenase n=1 Tax=Natronocella acetinitrilica TaxID=414046 RepID=A0AAE3G2D3_9GAMM|nr:NAD-dependent succinate-semialdehyde dehydrogenase [Natronocella acetinitrilica]MCP1673769.1 succinate-semialdehyde dehydrogenase/glutarate-semialdehyde dehydrogenase [Natronocella acetinitrilica]